MRMNPEAREQLRRTLVFLFRQLDCAVVGARPGAATDQKDLVDAGLFGTRQYSLAVGVEFAALKVRVAVDVHGLDCKSLDRMFRRPASRLLPARARGP